MKHSNVQNMAEHDQDQEIAYILKGYPRTSETFIANEIRLLEKSGIRLRIFPLLQPEGQDAHGVFDQIKAKLSYAPQVNSPHHRIPALAVCTAARTGPCVDSSSAGLQRATDETDLSRLTE